MAKFNLPKTKEVLDKVFTESLHGQLTTNLAGGEAYSQKDKSALISLLLTSFLNDKFYKDGATELKDLRNLVAKIADKKWVAKAAIYARNEFGMRSVTHVVASELAKNISGEYWAQDFYNAVVKRPDDMLEILSYYIANNAKNVNGKKAPIPNSIKKGFARAFDKWDSYQLAKYKSSGKSLSLVDLVNITHPIPTVKNAEGLSALVNGTLKNTQTWESKLSAAGNSDNVEDAKSQAWEELLIGKQLGYLALIRNLRNIIEQAPQCVNLAAEALVNEQSIKKSLVMPFQLLKAMEEINSIAPKAITNALKIAMDISLMNAPKWDGETLIALDVSGSMSGVPSNIGSLFAAALVKANGCDLMTFDSVTRMVKLDSSKPVYDIKMSIPFNGGGTDFKPIFRNATKKYDRIIILSDMQAWEGYYCPRKEYLDYCKRFGVKTKIYSFDLNGHGSLQFPEDMVYSIAGWSDKVFDLMHILENDRDVLINTIETVEF